MLGFCQDVAKDNTQASRHVVLDTSAADFEIHSKFATTSRMIPRSKVSTDMLLIKVTAGIFVSTQLSVSNRGYIVQVTLEQIQFFHENTQPLAL